MKSEDLKKIIRSIIQEEVRNQLPALIPQVLTEILNGKTLKSNIKTPPTVPRQSVESRPVQKEVKKEFKKYTNNPLLNEVLNQTVNKIVPEGSFVGYMERPYMSPVDININDPAESMNNNDSIDYSSLNESVAPTRSVPVVANVAPVNEDQAKVLGKINRDFRSLMKAVDEKRKNGTGGMPMNVSY